MLDPGPAVELQVLVDLGLLLARGRLVDRELDLAAAVGHDLAHQRRVLGGDVVADELLHVGEAHHPGVEPRPVLHPAQLHVADAVVDAGEERPRPRRRRGQRLGRRPARQVRPRVGVPLDQRVPGLAERRDGGHHGLAEVVLQQPGRGQRRAPRATACSYAAVASGTPMARSVTPSPCRATCAPSSVPARTGPRNTNRAVARLQHVAGLVPAAGLRPPVGDAAHAERGRVVVRGLARVADGEHHRVHARDGEVISPVYAMRPALPPCHQTAQQFVISLDQQLHSYERGSPA